MSQKYVAFSKSQRVFSTIRINKQRCLLLAYSLFVLFVLFEPNYISGTSFHFIFRIAKYVSALLVLSVFLIRRTKLNALLVETILFEGLLLFSTFINQSSIEQWFSDCAYVIIIMLFAQTVMEIDAQIFPLALSVVLGLYTHINSISRLLYPSGMYVNVIGYRSCWFLGYDNIAGMVILLAHTVAMFRIFYYRNRLLVWDWSVLISGCWFVLIQKMATVLVAETIFFCFIFVSKIQWFRKRFSKGLLIVLGMILLFFLIQFASIQDNRIFSFAFELLQKKSTFTGRTKVWSAAWREIQNGSWLLGRGLHTTAMYQSHFGGLDWRHLHSYYLQVIYEGGVFAFSAFLGILIHTAVRFDYRKFSSTYMPFLAGLLATMLMWQVEAYNDLIQYGFVILSLMSNVSFLSQYEETASAPRIQFVFHRSIQRNRLS